MLVSASPECLARISSAEARVARTGFAETFERVLAEHGCEPSWWTRDVERVIVQHRAGAGCLGPCATPRPSTLRCCRPPAPRSASRLPCTPGTCSRAARWALAIASRSCSTTTPSGSSPGRPTRSGPSRSWRSSMRSAGSTWTSSSSPARQREADGRAVPGGPRRGVAASRRLALVTARRGDEGS